MGEVGEAEGQTDTPAPPAPPSKEQQYSNEVRQMAQAALDAGNAIIAENRLSTTPSGVNLAWVLTGENSFAAIALKEALTNGRIEGGRNRISLPLKVDDQIPGLSVPHDLAKAFVAKMGFSVPQTKEGWKKLYDEKRNVVVFSDPENPFTVEGAVDGTSSGGEPRLVSFSLVPKTPPPNVG